MQQVIAQERSFRSARSMIASLLEQEEQLRKGAAGLEDVLQHYAIDAVVIRNGTIISGLDAIRGDRKEHDTDFERLKKNDGLTVDCKSKLGVVKPLADSTTLVTVDHTLVYTFSDGSAQQEEIVSVYVVKSFGGSWKVVLATVNEKHGPGSPTVAQ